MNQNIILIAAQSHNGCIGIDGKLPWHIPEELKYFREITLGNVVVMGRKTWESLPTKPLDKRVNIVLSRQKDYKAEGAIVFHSLEDLLSENINKTLICIGGAEIYKQMLPLAQRLYLTTVHKHIKGTDYFPYIEPENWKVISASTQYGETSKLYYTKRVMNRIH